MKLLKHNIIPNSVILYLLFVTTLFAKEVCLFTLDTEAEKVDGKVLHVPYNTVAMSGKMKVDIPSAVKKSATGKASVMFVIDNSGSMHNYGKDQMGSRFTVAKAFIDSLYEMNPKIEVGLTVFASHLWFDKNDDPLFEEVTEFGGFTDGYDKGAYLPLLKLNGDYNSKSGREVLHHYLQTDTLYSGNGINYVTTKYAPSTFKPEKGTNISLAFDAAKASMKNAENPKHKQFIIFLSDGEPSVPNTGYKEYFASGNDTPCTFTIYFTPSGEVPFILEKMTNNIKGNGFSSANNGSSITSLETNHDALLDYIMENIFDQIIKSTKSGTPLEIDINGKTNTKWEGGFFSFADIFPLKQKTTPFSFAIDYNIVHDSITENGDTINLGEYDTTTTSDFHITIGHSDEGDSSLIFRYWDREIVVIQNGTEKNQLQKTDPITLQFIATKIDTLISYEEVTLSLRTTQSKDKEVIELNPSSSLFEKGATIEIATAKQNDGKIQVDREDTLLLFFQNETLPFDTLSYRIPFTQKEEIRLSEVVYFDSTSDGKIDHITFQFIGDSESSIYEEAVDSLLLPDERDFIKRGTSVSNSLVKLTVSENSNKTRTSCFDFDVVQVKDSIELSNGTVLLPTGKLSIIDSVAPVIISATVVDSVFYEKHGNNQKLLSKGEDYLFIQFSEIVESVTDKKPFDLYNNQDNSLYELILDESKQTSNSHQFLIKSNEPIAKGDSIHISVNKVADLVGNHQDSKLNIKRVIQLDSVVTNEYRTISLERTDAFDTNGDGFMDSLVFHFDQDEIDFYADKIINIISLPKWRELKDIQKAATGINWFSIRVEEDRSTPVTEVLKEDFIAIDESLQIHEGTILQKGNILLSDSMAPVIVEAKISIDETLYLTGGKDSLVENNKPELSVLFSETIESPQSKKPFYLYRTSNDDKRYEFYLSTLKENDKSYTFLVDSLTLYDSHVEGDSIHIGWEQESIISDLNELKQNHYANRKVELEFMHRLDTQIVRLPFILKPYATLLDRSSESNLPDFIKESTIYSSLVGDCDSDSCRSVLLFQLRPEPLENVTKYDSFKAQIRVLDKVGNIVVEKESFYFFEELTSLFWIWDGKNRQGRFCGEGMYMAILDITYYQDNKVLFTKQIEHPIGIKR